MGLHVVAVGDDSGECATLKLHFATTELPILRGLARPQSDLLSVVARLHRREMPRLNLPQRRLEIHRFWIERNPRRLVIGIRHRNRR